MCFGLCIIDVCAVRFTILNLSAYVRLRPRLHRSGFQWNRNIFAAIRLLVYTPPEIRVSSNVRNQESKLFPNTHGKKRWRSTVKTHVHFNDTLKSQRHRVFWHKNYSWLNVSCPNMYLFPKWFSPVSRQWYGLDKPTGGVYTAFGNEMAIRVYSFLQLHNYKKNKSSTE